MPRFMRASTTPRFSAQAFMSLEYWIARAGETCGVSNYSAACSSGADARQDDLDPRAAARLGIEIEPAAEPIGHDAVDDVQAKPGAALVAPRREERIEGAAANIEAHAAAIVGEQDLDIVLAGLAHLDIDRARPAVRESVRHRIEEQIGQHLPVGPG